MKVSKKDVETGKLSDIVIYTMECGCYVEFQGKKAVGGGSCPSCIEDSTFEELRFHMAIAVSYSEGWLCKAGWKEKGKVVKCGNPVIGGGDMCAACCD